MAAIYSTDRERRLRLVLRVSFVAGAALLLLVVMVLLFGGYLFAMLVSAVTGSLLVGSAWWALRRLPGRDSRARLAAVVNGVVALLVGIVCGIFLDAGILALALVAVAVSVLVLALLHDDPELV